METDWKQGTDAREGRGNVCGRNVREILDRQNWEELLPRLLRYSVYLIRVKGSRGGNVAAGKMAEDYVMDAVMKVYKGERRWDPEKCPDILQYFIGVLRSIISHEPRKVENRAVVFWDDLSDLASQASCDDSAYDESGGDMLDNFLRFIGRDPKLAAFAACAAQGMKPREIALQMNITPGAAYNIRKIVKRRLAEFLSKNHAGRGGTDDGT